VVPESATRLLAASFTVTVRVIFSPGAYVALSNAMVTVAGVYEAATVKVVAADVTVEAARDGPLVKVIAAVPAATPVGL
jgi:hypothetical protein